MLAIGCSPWIQLFNNISTISSISSCITIQINNTPGRSPNVECMTENYTTQLNCWSHGWFWLKTLPCRLLKWSIILSNSPPICQSWPVVDIWEATLNVPVSKKIPSVPFSNLVLCSECALRDKKTCIPQFKITSN